MNKNTYKKIWCTVADIPENTVYMMSIPIRGFFDIWPKMGLAKGQKEYFTWFKGDISWMCYPRQEFEIQSEFLANKIIKNPDWALKIIDKVEFHSKEFFKKSKQISKYNLKRLSDRELIKVFYLPFKHHQFSHVMGASVGWQADAEKERVTKFIMREIDKQIKSNKLNLITSVVFSILSTYPKSSFLEQEEIDFLGVAKKIKQKHKLKTIFIYSDLEYLAKELKNIDKGIYKIILKHYQKYNWYPYQYRGQPYNLEYYLSRWQAFIKEGKSPQLLINKIINNKKSIVKKQAELKKKLKLSKYQSSFVKLSQQMMYIKELRKMALYHGMYHYELVFVEVGRRLGLSLDQVRAMNYWEIEDALLQDKFNANELNSRQKECVAYYDGKKYVVLTGGKYKKFIKNIKFEKIKITKVNELYGTCASPGKVKGIVKIVNLPLDMKKMKTGDILVAHNTNPNLVPAMKKAGAMLSEAGGLTCHTAIVARELKIPCIVGVPQVDKVLKDGDMVEVDATNGVIKKIK